jgi:hypothetical protein
MGVEVAAFDLALERGEVDAVAVREELIRLLDNVEDLSK